MDLIYVDFDGVAHPGEVWYEPASRQARLRAPGHELFESLPILEAAIAPYPSLAIVLSTSWVQTFGFEHARDRLPETLQRRVIGAIVATRHCLAQALQRSQHVRLARPISAAENTVLKFNKPQFLAAQSG